MPAGIRITSRATSAPRQTGPWRSRGLLCQSRVGRSKGSRRCSAPGRPSQTPRLLCHPALAHHQRATAGAAHNPTSALPSCCLPMRSFARLASGRSPGADVAAVGKIPVQMWQRRAQSRCRCAHLPQPRLKLVLLDGRDGKVATSRAVQPLDCAGLRGTAPDAAECALARLCSPCQFVKTHLLQGNAITLI
jgi:hypothetical protein